MAMTTAPVGGTVTTRSGKTRGGPTAAGRGTGTTRTAAVGGEGRAVNRRRDAVRRNGSSGPQRRLRVPDHTSCCDDRTFLTGCNGSDLL